MRIDRLTIERYRNLQGFEIDFDEAQPTTVLLGRNGSGKSNLIEAIVEIFRDLESGAAPSFKYSLAYFCNGKTVEIDADPERSTRRVVALVDGQSISQAAFRDQLDALLPRYVFAYYSGWSSRLERHFEKPTRDHYERVLNNSDGELPLRRMFFCRKEYSQLVLLAFFLSRTPAVSNLLTRYLSIASFESVLFVLKRPWWRGAGAPRGLQLSQGDRRFWYARGAFKGFLDRLWRAALAPIRREETVERDIRRQPENTERLYLFIKNQSQLALLKQEHESTKMLFGYLEGLFLCDLIDEVRVTVRRSDGSRVKFTQMSEGEQQLLTVLGLLLFTQDDESLYLLDEPDTHLNPVWTYDYLKLLQDNMRAEKGQLIVATHNPLMIGSLRRNQVRLLETACGAETKRLEAREPEDDPFAMGVDGLLTSELYGLPSVLPKEITNKIDERNRLFALQDRDPQQEGRLSELSEELSQLGILRSYSDPYEQAFVEALARRRKSEHDMLSADELKARNQEADAILEEIIAREEGGK